MQIVTDSATDTQMLQNDQLKVHIVPLKVNLGDDLYRDGIDISADDFYLKLEESRDLPVTSQPSVGDFVEVYRKIAREDPDILSIHMSSGLSGTVDSARAAAELVPEANITIVDTKTLSAVSGWQVAAAFNAIKAGWSKEAILTKLDEISAAAHTFYTLKDLKYLIHGGRISHMKGLVASVLQIKPFIGVDKVTGKYIQVGQARSFSNALNGLVDTISKNLPSLEALKVQVVHTGNPEGAETLKERINKVFKCDWLPTGQISFVLGAHTGPSMVGVAFAPLRVLEGLV
ncbi:MAG: fatty acid kinase fatty acid binding subunit [Chloroflexota bacterium]|nr:fatty acid kinase fatty acid binding subunit [Chloroflexota bacterium]